MTGSRWPDTFDTILRRYLPLSGGAPIAGRSLIDLGLDSRALISILVEIEDEFEVEFPDDYINLQTFGDAATLWGVVDDLRSHESDQEQAIVDLGRPYGG
ncbi:phosphopantetheine binding protein [Micromonospora sp. Llam0]|uniref:phosphopantetheine-binding protein n=1 Tax=Micromonospora sp. Llam0 TaxID=2485143 RepID=UPI000F46FB21|nr:phosphopantetheine-binding protein [Micromonospora sp. Llam0]ROO60619.1 phosphopantetheine binding protein [Micromonospora sp. Llam0]